MPTLDKILSIASIHPPEDIDLSLIDSLDITEITSETLQDYFADLYDNKGVRGTLYSKCKEYIVSILEYAKRSGYIDEVPQIKFRSKEHTNLFKKPDAEIIKHILSHSKGLPVETIIRLAWECGLTRAEISTLKYDEVDFKNGKIVLPDRKIPIHSSTLKFLKKLKARNIEFSDYVLISQKKEAPMAEQSISRIIRSELDKYDQKEVRLSDLRMDYIIDCLKNNSVEYVSYIAGVDIRTIQVQYLPYVGKVIEVNMANKVNTPDYNSIYQYMLGEKDSITGLALWFGWQLGMQATELVTLTWDMVDFDNAKINSVSIPDELLKLLRNLKADNAQYSDHIFLSHTTKKPVDRSYISKTVKESFVKNGFFDLNLSKLCKELSPERLGLKKKLIAYMTKYGHSDKKTIANEFNITGKEAGNLLKDLRDTGEIVLVGKKYFLQGTVVSPENQDKTILNYVKEHPFSTRKELSNLLGLANRRQLLPIVEPLIEQGKLKRTEDQKYYLAEDK